jgi:glycosyltransferase involved in cell wall biosynthesis
VNICTIIARNYVAHARVLAKSFQEIHPDGTCSVLVIDDPSGFIDPADEPFELVTIEEIGLAYLEQMAASYDVMELSTAVKPWFLRHLLERPDVDSVAYLDPDIQIFDSIEEIDQRARRHNVVLTPHFTAPLPRDNLKPAEEDILIAGTYNLGFIALGASETAHSLLDWWSERLETHCLNNPEEGHFVDQRWIDLAPGLWPGIDVLRDPGFNVAYWNLPTRRFEENGSGYEVDSRPLRFFHFSGFNPLRPDELSRHQTRVDVATNPALSRICREYGTALLDHGFEDVSGWPYGWDEMGNGARLDRAARRVHREGVEEGAISDSIFTETGAKQFIAYLNEPESATRSNTTSRYAKAVWASRPDLRRIFPNIDGESASAFAYWMRETATDTEISRGLLTEPPATDGEPAARPRPIQLERGVNVIGYLSSERGVGEAGRQALAALEAGGSATTTIDSPTDPDEIRKALGSIAHAAHPYDVNLTCVNADMLPVVAAGLSGRFFDGRHSIGLWFWEVSRFPDQWRASFKLVDEVWVASEHIAKALRPISPVPVWTMRLPITPAVPEPMSRAELGMPEGFCFLFVFDYRSVFRRKNPLGIVKAFRDAFEPGSGPSLVIKSICGDEFPAEREALAEAVRDRPDIHLIEEMLPLNAKDAMIAGCDCYVSLHRSEGLGLTMAEAMYFERPVIATAYSGNLDFMTAENSYLVAQTMTKIGDDASPYPSDGEWAEPDLGQASALMRQVFEDQRAAAERGRRAAADIRRTHSLEATGRAIEARLAKIRRKRLIARLRHPSVAQPLPGVPPSAREELEHLLKIGVAPHPEGSGRIQAAAKRLYRRALRPYTAHQQRIDSTATQSLDELREMLSEILEMEDAVDAKLAATNERLRMLQDALERDR